MSLTKQIAGIAGRKNQEDLTSRAAQDYSNLSGVSIFGTPDQVGGELAARKVADLYYGGPRQIAEDAANYRGLVKSNIGKPSALAGRLTQVSNQELSRAGAQTAGADSPAARIKARRESISKSNEMQQAEDRANLDNYRKSIGAGISGTEAMAAAGAGRGLASTSTPTPDYGSSCPMCIVATQLFLNREISKDDLLGVMKAGRSFDKDSYIGYILLAQPFLKIESNFLKKMVIPAFKAYADGKPNLFAKAMILSSKIIGFLYSKTGLKIHLRLLKKATVNDILMKKEMSC